MEPSAGETAGAGQGNAHTSTCYTPPPERHEADDHDADANDRHDAHALLVIVFEKKIYGQGPSGPFSFSGNNHLYVILSREDGEGSPVARVSNPEMLRRLRGSA